MTPPSPAGDAPIVISGPMGAGKTVVGQEVARRLGWAHVDSDDEIAGRSGAPLATVFRTLGEPRFRDLEAEVVAENLRPKCVLSLGGGAHLRPDTRALLAEHRWVQLEVEEDVAWARVGGDASRPLAGERGPFTQRWQERTDAGRDAPVRLRADSAVGAVAGALLDAFSVPAEAGPESTAVEWSSSVGGGGADSRYALGEWPIGALAERLVADGAVAVAAVVDPAVGRPARDAVFRDLRATGLTVHRMDGFGGESEKRLDRALELIDRLLELGLRRSDAVVLVGGGVLGDVGGLAAALVRRGLPCHLVPTTVLAMADASVGGKLGVDHPRGKNLIGLIQAPAGVWAATSFLRTLSPRLRRAGLAEILKIGLLFDPGLWRAALAVGADRNAEPVEFATVIRRAVAWKAAVVEEDWGERGRRRLLNLGHTVGHAWESAHGHAAVHHGEAVAIGLCAEAYVAGRLGWASMEIYREVDAGLRSVQLPVKPVGPTPAAFWTALSEDKKWGGTGLAWPFLRGVGVCAEERVTSQGFEDVCRLLTEFGFWPPGET